MNMNVYKRIYVMQMSLTFLCRALARNEERGIETAIEAKSLRFIFFTIFRLLCTVHTIAKVSDILTDVHINS